MTAEERPVTPLWELDQQRARTSLRVAESYLRGDAAPDTARAKVAAEIARAWAMIAANEIARNG